jgi:cyclophilin family peptidyl-prolyl cis-trans isomerase
MRTARAALIVVVALLLAGCAGGDESTAPETTAPAATSTAADGCESVEAPPVREDGGATQPTERLDPEKTWTLRFATSCGDFVVTLDTTSAPATAASLVSLAEQGYFDDTVFHRIVPGFVIQGGDPTQSGSGGPGYSTVDPPAPTAGYTKGVVAMAKTQDEPAGTSGSQFFVVTGDDVGLPPDYAVVGEVTEGLDVVELIGTLGDPATEQPLQPIVVESVTVSSS